MKKIIYRRLAHVQASHFNDANTYAKYKRGEDVLDDCHGHNFIINIEFEKAIDLDNGETFVMDDEFAMEKINEWYNKNLTIHEDFKKYDGRVSLELMCYILAEKFRGTIDRVKVNISETRDIEAEYETSF